MKTAAPTGTARTYTTLAALRSEGSSTDLTGAIDALRVSSASADQPQEHNRTDFKDAFGDVAYRRVRRRQERMQQHGVTAGPHFWAKMYRLYDAEATIVAKLAEYGPFDNHEEILAAADTWGYTEVLRQMEPDLAPGAIYDPDTAPNALLQMNAVWTENWRERFFAEHTSMPDKLKVGFISNEYTLSVVQFFLMPILGFIDRERFDVSLISMNSHTDRMTDDCRALAQQKWGPDGWIDLSHETFDEAAQHVLHLDLDILVDLDGDKWEVTKMVVVQNVAPATINYLGYPATTGLPIWRFTDWRADPPENDALHSEHLCRLPETFLCYQPLMPLPAIDPLPPMAANGFVTFGCFNNPAKLNREVAWVFAQVLERVPSSILEFRYNKLRHPQARQRVTMLMESAGTSASRLRFPLQPDTQSSFVAAYNLVDVALDVFPYNGTTTTVQTCIMGVPLVTLKGYRPDDDSAGVAPHVSRVSYSILHTLGHPEWAADDELEYVRVAAELCNVATLTDIRATLRDSWRNSALGDPTKFVPSFQDALEHVFTQTNPRLEPHQRVSKVDAAPLTIELP